MPSRHISAKYGVACPTCGAAADDACRARTTGRITDTHAARIRARYEAVRLHRPEETP